DPNSSSNLARFRAWVEKNVIPSGSPLLKKMVEWLPPQLSESPGAWVRDVASSLLEKLDGLGRQYLEDHPDVPEASSNPYEAHLSGRLTDRHA
ncbi:MAG: hypothetical protein ACREEC_01340, partial [Thermoplasmata archaeon]